MNREIYGKSFGNLLSCYWHVRAYCIFNNIDFDFSKFTKIGNGEHCAIKSISGNLFSCFPMKIEKKNIENSVKKDIEITDDYVRKKLGCKNTININDFTENYNNRLYLYWSSLYLGSWTHIIPIIQNDTTTNIKNYLDMNQLFFPNYSKNQVVIHFRCGNVLSGDTHPSYYLLKFKYFKDHIPENTEKITIIWRISYNDKNTQKETGILSKDEFIIGSLKKYLEKELDIEVNIDNEYFSDFIYMLYAPTLIITPSTFSFWAGIMSRNTCFAPSCDLLCGGKNPNIRDNFIWTDIEPYKISAHFTWKMKHNNEKLLEELLK